MKRVGITVDGAELRESLAPTLHILDAEAFVVEAAPSDAEVDRDLALLDQLAFAIGERPFPRREQRRRLSVTEQSQVRATLALYTHCRRGGEMFVSADTASFGADGSARRRALEELVGTPILSASQLRHWARAGDRRRRAA